MVTTKFTTQTWSKSPQTSSKFQSEEKMNYLPATKQDDSKDKSSTNVGEVLNQVANAHGPNKEKARKPNNELGKDDFLKLMITQMKNQDPLNPMQSHEMAAQLAQFTSLEQLFNVNKNLETIGKGQDPVQKYESLNLLGKTISADTRDVIRTKAEGPSDLRFKLHNDSMKVKALIVDEKGQTVRILEMAGLKKGENKMVWDGLDKNERVAPPGKYMFALTAVDSSNKPVATQTETKGMITGINYSPEGPLLMVGNQTVRLNDVQRIEDSGLKEMQAAKEEKPPGLKMSDIESLLKQPRDSAQNESKETEGYEKEKERESLPLSRSLDRHI